MYEANQRHRWFWSILGLALAIGVPAVVNADSNEDDDIIAEVISAPVVTNGVVANEPTEINIILTAKGVPDARALDPEAFGHQIPAGGRMVIELGEGFARNTDSEGNPIPIKPNANLILTIAPQNPIIAQSGDTVARGNWAISDNGANTITVTPQGGHGKNGLENARAKEVGVKVIHIRPNPRDLSGTPYINGEPGEVGTVHLRIYDAHNRLREAGVADVVFQPRVGPQIHNTNAGLRTRPGGSPQAETVEMVQFQRVAPGTALTNTAKTVPFSAGRPYAPRFLLFAELDPSVRGAFTAASFIPQPGIADVTYAIEPHQPWKARLVQQTASGERTIGAVVLSGPSADSRGELLPSPAPTTTGGNGSILNVPVRVGDEDGIYRLKVTLLDGSSATNHIVVENGDDDDEDED